MNASSHPAKSADDADDAATDQLDEIVDHFNSGGTHSSEDTSEDDQTGEFNRRMDVLLPLKFLKINQFSCQG